MRVGVIGCGYWGSKHVRVLHGIPEVTQVVVIDQDPERRAAMHRVFPNTVGFSTLDEAADHVDAVVVATPPTSHAPVGLDAIARGKHVMVEKPLATSSVDGQLMVDRAAEEGVVLMVGHTFEYNAAVQRLRDIVQTGQLGEIYYFDSARLNLGLYQSDVNVVWDLAPHDISVANYVLADRPTAVTAWGSAHAHAGVEDVAMLRLDYGTSGVVATMRNSWLDPCKVRRATVVGSEMMAVYNDLNDAERIKLYDRGLVQAGDGEAVHEMPLSYRYGDVIAPFVDFQEPLLAEDRHFVEAAITGIAPPTPGESGLEVVRIIEAANESIRTGRTVELRHEPAALRAV